MVTIYCEAINKEMLEVARMISAMQKDIVKLRTPTECVEVQYEKEAEMQTQEGKETQQQEVQEEP